VDAEHIAAGIIGTGNGAEYDVSLVLALGPVNGVLLRANGTLFTSILKIAWLCWVSC
jgi:hypothetical protein